MTGKKKGKRTKRVRDVIDVRKPGAAAIPPTAEQANHADYAEEKIFDRTPEGRLVLMGKAYRRRPKFETIEGLTVQDRRILRHYRATFDKSEMSEMKCALDVGSGGGRAGADAAIARLETLAFADWEVRKMEAGVLPALVPTLRAVALFDQDFKTLAIKRYGGREVDRIDTTGKRPRTVVTIEPKSGRHRAAVRTEFMDAMAQLSRATLPLLAKPKAVAPPPEAAPHAPIDPAYLDERGLLLPWDDIRAVILSKLNADE